MLYRLAATKPAGAVLSLTGNDHYRFRPPGGETATTVPAQALRPSDRLAELDDNPVDHGHPPRGSAPAAAWIGVSAVNDNNTSSVVRDSVSRVLRRSTLRVLRALRPRWREVTGLRARASVQAPTHSASQP